ncbi:FtsK/SpoIIIE domain-containing protein [Streptomyces sp. T028]|uniref:FtsK/SpoIIIE domain-containing protein n=1 Tax=Streptomyces sp. T028 TaxID=3394379 RepID=UPI003A84AD89
MELQLSVIDPAGDHRTDLLVDADPAAPVGSLALELARRLGMTAEAGRPPALHINGFRVDPELPLDASPVRDGVLVSIDGPTACPPPPAQGNVEIRVVGGPDAGGVHRLGPGAAVAGSGPEAWIRLADSALPSTAVEIDVAVDGSVAIDPAFGSSVTLDGEPVGGRTPWRRRSVVAVGQSLLELRDPVFPDTALKPSEDGTGLDYNRPPRITPPSRRTAFQLPPKPRQPDPHPLPWAMALLPLVGAVTLAVVMGRAIYLLIAVLSPLALVGNHLADRRHGRKSHRRTLAEYEQQKVSIDRQARRATAEETAARRDAHPDPAEVFLAATGPGQRLWERRVTDDDHGVLRVGTGTLPSEVELTDPDQQEHRRTERHGLDNVPVCVSLRTHGVLGVAGRGELPRAIGRWLVAQAAVLHSPTDLTVHVLTEPSGRVGWEWVRWLPHARAREGRGAVALLGTDADSVARRIAELLAALSARHEALNEVGQSSGRPWNGPSILVVLDGSRRLRALPGLTQVLRQGPRVGIHLICLDTDRRQLPEECRALVEEDHHGLLQVSQAGAEPVESVRPDCVTPQWAEQVARALAPVRDVTDEESGGLPDTCRLLDVIGMEPPSPDAIAARWSLNGRSTTAVIGESLDGAFAIDLVRDGPHGLVAGTTGSGKSELLQTIVASLAVANRPDAMTFVLVDYKGGAAFKDCVKLPHTVGMVTDLDTHLVERALVSLGAELRRREHILADAGTKDLEDYIVAMRGDPSLAPVPRLLIVIDEFASMARELPDFVTGLVNIAQRGRSLGIHLILATQRPSGVVSPEIRANTNLRIALRVTDASESTDVIDAPDSGFIAKSTPGRAFVRLGASSLLPFQSGRVGGRRPGRRAPDAPAAPWVVPVDWEAVGRPAPTRPAPAQQDDDLLTDLAVLVDAINAGADTMGFGEQHRPWLPPLTDTVTTGELPRPEPSGHGDVQPAVFGVTDVPSRQARMPLTLDLVDGSHLLLVGGPRSGRSTALRTLAGALASTASPSDVHLYGVDCGSNALMPLAELPHCGAVVTRDQTDRVTRLLGRLHQEVARRQQLLAMTGVAGAAEQRASAASPEERLPWLVLLLDGWEGYTAAFESYDLGKLVESMKRLFQDGPSVGLRVVMTADRSSLTGAVSSAFGDRLVLRMADPNDYASAGLSPRDVPGDMPPGRALRATDEGVQESQIALLAPDPSGQAQVQALRAIGREAAEAGAGRSRRLRPMRVDALPVRATVRDAYALDPDFTPPSPMWALLGVGGDELGPVGVDLSESGPGFVIAGPPRSGRSTTLVAAARSLLRARLPLVLITPRRSPLRGLEGEPGVLGVLRDGASPDDLRTLLARVHGGRYVVVVDDAELLYDTPLDGPLQEVVRSGRDGDHGLIAAGAVDVMSSQYRGFLVESRRSRSGVLLSPQNVSEGDLFSISLPRGIGGGPTGRGLLIRGGKAVPLQTVTEE